MASQEVVVLARMVVQADHVDDVERAYAEVSAALPNRPGLISQTLWRSTVYPERCALLTHYTDSASAEEDSEQLVESGLIERAAKAMGSAPDIKHFHLVDWVSGQLATFDMRGVMSLSIQVAPPGGLEERLDELQDMAHAFESLEGFRGYKFCRGVRVCDEVLSLMFWDSVPSFRASMPRQPLNPVEVFGRLA